MIVRLHLGVDSHGGCDILAEFADDFVESIFKIFNILIVLLYFL